MLVCGKLVCLQRLETTESIAHENYPQMNRLPLIAGKDNHNVEDDELWKVSAEH